MAPSTLGTQAPTGGAPDVIGHILEGWDPCAQLEEGATEAMRPEGAIARVTRGELADPKTSLGEKAKTLLWDWPHDVSEAGSKATLPPRVKNAPVLGGVLSGLTDVRFAALPLVLPAAAIGDMLISAGVEKFLAPTVEAIVTEGLSRGGGPEIIGHLISRAVNEGILPATLEGQVDAIVDGVSELLNQAGRSGAANPGAPASR